MDVKRKVNIKKSTIKNRKKNIKAILEKESPTKEVNNYIELSEYVKLNIGDATEFVSDKKYRMIYFDPPFNSDRDYRLTYKSKIGFSDKWTDKTYQEFISENVSILYDLLEDDGTLYFHISSSCMYIPEVVLRNKFKFVEPIFWKKCRSKNNVKNKLGSTVDIIWKCNKIAKPKFNLVYQEKNEVYLKNSFKNKDHRGNYSLGHLVTEKTKKGYMYSVELNNRIFNPESGWRIKESALKALIDDDRVHFPVGKNGNLYKKIYLHENPGKPCTDLWDDIHSISQGNEARKYPTAKPIKLLERLIMISTDEGDNVYDPMCGSGTTGEACNNLKRNCVLNDVNEDVIDIVKSRFE